MTDLDDFFAKKDKKKSKAKPKFLTAEELVKNLEDTTKREVVTKPKKVEVIPTIPSSETTGDTATINIKANEEEAAEEEWKEFEEEQRKDYTGLKLGQLTINDDEQSGGENYDSDADSENNTNSDTTKRSDGPWKKVVPAEEVTQIPMPESDKKVYVSPAFRQSQALAAAARVKSRKTAPDITNADYFPTLGAARPEEQRKKKNEPAFEEVRHGGRMQRVQESAPAVVSATNRFQSLDEDAS